MASLPDCQQEASGPHNESLHVLLECPHNMADGQLLPG